MKNRILYNFVTMSTGYGIEVFRFPIQGAWLIPIKRLEESKCLLPTLF
jgi:hypothetical protein